MKKSVIKAPLGAKYLNQLPEFMGGLPVNCLLDKGITGCGGTTIALQSSIDTIITMPYVSVIKNKMAQYPDKLLGVYAGITDEEILEYVQFMPVKKICVTYDSLDRVIKLLSSKNIDVYNEYYLLVDEWHILFNSYVFRDTAIKNLLSHSNKFSKVTYMTATPLEEEFILTEIAHLPIVEVQWEDAVKVNIELVQSNKPDKVAMELIKDNLEGKSFGNLHFFVNSVEFIGSILKKLALSPDDVRVVCSKNTVTGRGNKSNQAKVGAKYAIAETLDPVKKINFYTSTAFEGCDIYDENGRIVICSDSNKRHTMLDISTLVIQICGRIRNTIYNTEVLHIFNPSENKYNNLTLEEFTARKDKNLSDSKEILELVAAKSQLVMGKFTTDQLNNMYIMDDGDGVYNIDENLVKLDLANFKIVNHIYRSVYLLRDEYKSNGFNFEDSWKKLYPSDALVKNPVAKITFKDVFKEYANLKTAVAGKPGFTFGLERIAVINNTRPDVKQAYDKLGEDRVKELNYSTTNINRALIDLKPSLNTSTKIVKCLGLTPGTTIPVSEIKSKLQEVYDVLNLKDSCNRPRRATANDIKDWYEIKESRLSINGKTTRCITIISSKLIFK